MHHTFYLASVSNFLPFPLVYFNPCFRLDFHPLFPSHGAFHWCIVGVNNGKSAKKSSLKHNFAITLYLNVDDKATQVCGNSPCSDTDDAYSALQQYMHNHALNCGHSRRLITFPCPLLGTREIFMRTPTRITLPWWAASFSSRSLKSCWLHTGQLINDVCTVLTTLSAYSQFCIPFKPAAGPWFPNCQFHLQPGCTCLLQRLRLISLHPHWHLAHPWPLHPPPTFTTCRRSGPARTAGWCLLQPCPGLQSWPCICRSQALCQSNGWLFRHLGTVWADASVLVLQDDAQIRFMGEHRSLSLLTSLHESTTRHLYISAVN